LRENGDQQRRFKARPPRKRFSSSDIVSNFLPMNTTISFLTQEETKRLFAAIPAKRDRAIFLAAYRHGSADQYWRIRETRRFWVR
jgi:hypothetical protein